MSVPVPPIRQVWFRWVADAGRFVPCTESDRRCTLVTKVDALGRPVIAVLGADPYGGGGHGGWKLAHESAMVDPAQVVEFVADYAAERHRARKARND